MILMNTFVRFTTVENRKIQTQSPSGQPAVAVRRVAPRLPVFLAFVLFALGLTGCGTDKPDPSGYIYLDHGEVFTRQRLLNQRITDLNWLYSELSNTPTGTHLQGGRFRGETTTLNTGLSAQVTPMGALGGLNQQYLQSGVQAATLQNQFTSAGLQQELQALQDGSNYIELLSQFANATANTNGTGNPATPGLNFASNFSPSNIVTGAPANITIVNGATNGPLGSGLIPGGDTAPQLTSVEAFQDSLAYRDAVNGEIQERELDDTHDQTGMTLYTLAFHLSILPGDNNQWFGHVVATAGPSHTPRDYAHEYDLWFRSFQHLFDQEIISIQRRYLQNLLSDDELQQIALEAWRLREDVDIKLVPKSECFIQETKNFTNNAAQIVKIKESRLKEHTATKQEQEDQILALSNLNLSNQQLIAEMVTNKLALDYLQGDSDCLTALIPSGAPNSDPERAMRGLCLVVSNRFSVINQFTKEKDETQPSTNLVTFGNPTKIREASDDFMYLIPIDPLTNQDDVKFNIFGATIDSLNNMTRDHTFVYAISPKEYAQNFADASARQSVVNASLGLSAVLPPTGSSISAYLNYIRQNQYLLEAIKRKPLLTGFIESSNTFGWLVGPRFNIDKNLELGYEQEAQQEAVQVTLELPSWWNSVKITSSNEWLQANGSPYSRTNYVSFYTQPKYGPPGTNDVHGPDTITNSYDIALKPDWDALTYALLEYSDPSFAQPQIDPDWHPDSRGQGYALEANQPAQIVIRGRNLWRNPKIFIGNQQIGGDYDYTILPDMNGLVAKIDLVQAPPNAPVNGFTKVDLRVDTSDGESILRNAVTIYSGNSKATNETAFVQMKDAFGVAGGTVVFAINTNLAPANASYLLALGPTNEKPQPRINSVGTIVNSLTNSLLNFTLPPLTNLWSNNATDARVDVWMRLTPTSEPVSVLQGGEQSFVIFTNETQADFAFVSPNATIATNTNVAIKLPDGVSTNLFWSARSGLYTALHSGNAILCLTHVSSTNSATLNLTAFDFNQNTFSFSAGKNIATVINSLGLNPSSPTSCTGSVLVPSAQDPRWTIPVVNNINLITVTNQ